MKNQNFNKGLTLTALGSFWWGVIGVIYFKYISFAGPIEVVIHRCIWTSAVLIITTFYFSKWKIFFEIITNKKKLAKDKDFFILMTIAEKLGKTVEEMMETSTLEFQMWVAYFELKNELEAEAMKRAN